MSKPDETLERIMQAVEFVKAVEVCGPDEVATLVARVDETAGEDMSPAMRAKILGSIKTMTEMALHPDLTFPARTAFVATFHTFKALGAMIVASTLPGPEQDRLVARVVDFQEEIARAVALVVDRLTREHEAKASQAVNN